MAVKMAQLSKDQMQRLILGLLLLVVGGAMVQTMLLQPMKKDIEANINALPNLEKTISELKREVRTSEQIAQKAVQLAPIPEQVFKDIPTGAPITWFPPQMTRYLEGKGAKNVVIARGGISKPGDPSLAMYDQLTWNINISAISYLKLGELIAALETDYPLIQVSSININMNMSDPEFQVVTLTCTYLLPAGLN